MNSLNNISLVQHIWNACEGQVKYGKKVKLHMHVKTKKVSIRLELSILFAGPIQLVRNSGNINVNQQIKSFSSYQKKNCTDEFLAIMAKKVCHSNFTNRVALLQILISCLQSLRPTYLMPCLFSCNQTQCKSTHSK